MAIEAGTRIGHYKIISLLGKGGMGEVYLALDSRLGRRIALKILSPDLTKKEDRVLRFQQEARAASALNHPNIITIYEVGQIDSTYYIATEFIDGQTLRRHISESKMGVREAIDVALQVAGALAEAHEAGIVHRDIKPENIMLRPDGYVKVLDFGLAKLIENTAERKSASSEPEAVTDVETGAVARRIVETEHGTVLGTISYMSPEQTQGLRVDLRTDIFSLGVVLYEMIAGRVPFDGTSPLEMIIAISRMRAQPLARYSRDVPAELEWIVSKALEKKAEERYQSIKELLNDLKKLKQQLDLKELRDSAPQEVSAGATLSSGSQGLAPAREPASGEARLTTPMRSTSSAEYIISEIKRHKRDVLFSLAACLIVVVGFTFFLRDTRKSVVVLPFASVSSDAGTKELNLLILKRLINNLSRFPNLKVTPFSSVARYADQAVDPLAVGRELGIKNILTCSVFKREGDDNLAVNIELVNAKDGGLIFGEQYERKFADLRMLQEEILKTVSEKLGLELNEEEKKLRLAESLYQEGRNYYEKRTRDGLKRGMEFFQRAIDINPNHALGYAGLADCHTMLVVYGAESPKNGFPKAIEAAERALKIDDNLAEAHTSLAWVRFRTWDWAGAESEFRLAIRLNPNYTQAHQLYANYLAAMGRPLEAIEEGKRAQELDPTSLIASATLAYVYYNAHQFDRAIEQGKQTLKLDPNFFAARRYLALAYAQTGMYAEALEAAQKAVENSKGSGVVKAEYGSTLALAGKKKEARRIIEELKEGSTQGYLSPYHTATIYACLGEKDEAFKWLEKTFDEKGDFLIYAKVDPKLESLRPDARFQDLMRRMGLE